MPLEDYGIVDHTEQSVSLVSGGDEKKIQTGGENQETVHRDSVDNADTHPDADKSIAIGNETIYFDNPDNVYRFFTTHTVAVPVEDFVTRVNRQKGSDIVNAEALKSAFKLGLQKELGKTVNKDARQFCALLDGLKRVQGGKLTNDTQYVRTVIDEYMGRFTGVEVGAKIGDYSFDRPAVDKFMSELIYTNKDYYTIVRDIIYPPQTDQNKK